MPTHRALAPLLLAALLGLTTTGCTPTPDPTPTPTTTGWATDTEALTAAETTYRAYVNALNERQSGAVGAVEPTEFLTGLALRDEIASAQKFDELGLHSDGHMKVASMALRSAEPSSISIFVCLDASAVHLIDSSGADVTPAERGDVLGLDVELVWTPDGALISNSMSSNEPC